MRKLNSYFAVQKSAILVAVLGLTMQAAIADSPLREQPAPANYGCGSESISASMREFPSSKWITADLLACLPFQSNSFGASEPVVSPTGAIVAQWHNGSPAPLEIAGIKKPDYAQFPNQVGFRTFTLGFPRIGRERTAFAWFEDGRRLWTVRQNVLPSGFGVGGLVPITLGVDGKPSDLPELHHNSGPLDGLQWIGGKGLALAQFGTKGGYYRPDHADPSPTYAIVDGQKGKIRAILPLSAIPEFAGQTERDVFRFSTAVATATTLPNGKVRAVLQYGPLSAEPGFRIVWTEGLQPLMWRDYEDNRSDSSIVLSPDGSKLLVNLVLQPNGMQVFDCDRGRNYIRECSPPPTPVTGTIAELIDLKTQKGIWQVPARATVFWSQRTNPAISPDGRFALVEMPSDDNQRIIGLISMADGKLLEQFAGSHTGSMPIDFGFMTDGKHAWVMCNGIFIRYRMTARPAG